MTGLAAIKRTTSAGYHRCLTCGADVARSSGDMVRRFSSLWHRPCQTNPDAAPLVPLTDYIASRLRGESR